MKNWLSTDKHSFFSWEKWLSLAFPAGILVILLVLWEVIVNLAQIDKWILPSPSSIFISFWQSKELFWLHGLQTITETILGFSGAIVVGVMVAILIDLSIWLRRAIYPMLVVSQTVPILAIAPLFVIWFGYGIAPKVVIVGLVCFFPIAVNLADGFRLVDKDMIRFMETLGASKMQIFRMVKIPSALPFFFSGLRIAGTYSVMGAVIGEWLGASKGLGVLMTRSSQSYMTDRVFATIMVITLLSLLIILIIEFLARVTMPWYYRKQQQSK